MSEPETKLIALIEGLSAKSFADHVIETELNQGVFRSFRCGQPKSSTYMFRITTIPGRLIVTGDIGVLIVERLRDMFAWAPTAINDIHYFAQKVPQEIPLRVFDQDVASDWIQELMTAEGTESELAKQAAELEETLGDNTEPGVFMQEVYDSGIIDGCDFPDFNNWKPSFLWCREAVRWFFQNASAEQLSLESADTPTATGTE